MKLLFPVLVFLALAAAPANANDVFRTVDAQGHVIYSDRPLSADSQRVNVVSAATDPERVAAEAEALRTSEAERRTRAPEGSDMAAARTEQSALRAQACREAREAAETYERAPRLYEELPNGGRRFLTDDELIRIRQGARQAVIDFCED